MATAAQLKNAGWSEAKVTFAPQLALYSQPGGDPVLAVLPTGALLLVLPMSQSQYQGQTWAQAYPLDADREIPSTWRTQEPAWLVYHATGSHRPSVDLISPAYVTPLPSSPVAPAKPSVLRGRYAPPSPPSRNEPLAAVGLSVLARRS